MNQVLVKVTPVFLKWSSAAAASCPQDRVANHDGSPVGVGHLTFGCLGGDDLPVLGGELSDDLVGGENMSGSSGRCSRLCGPDGW